MKQKNPLKPTSGFFVQTIHTLGAVLGGEDGG